MKEMLTSKVVPTVQTSGADESTREASFEGQFCVIFISPEQLLGKNKWRDMLRTEKALAAFAVDEANCVKKW